MPGGRGGRSLGLVCAAAVTLAPAAAAASHKARPVSLRITNSAAGVRRGAPIVVSIRAKRAMRVRVFGQLRGGIVVTSVRSTHVGRTTRRLSLRQLAAGRSALGGCARTTLEVVVVRFNSVGVRARAIGRARLRLDAGSNCHATAKAIPYPNDGNGRCDPIDPAVCLQPWPNDYFTVGDPSTATGRRVALARSAMPRNVAGVSFDPSDINRNDGFSPGSPVVTKVPGMDTPAAFARTGAVGLVDLARAYDDGQPVVVLNARTLQRQPIWTELDANPSSPRDVNLIIHPAVNFAENTRYIVVLRNMRDASGAVLPAGQAFSVYRDRIITTSPVIEARRSHFEGLFANLALAGIDRGSVYRAWDFTVASERSLSERQLAIRDDAFRQLGDTNLTDLRVAGRAPAFSVTKVTSFTPAQNTRLARQVEGTFTVPCYLDLPGCPAGSRFLYGPNRSSGVPIWLAGNSTEARFTCNIPRIAVADGGARPSLYGHGLFGSRGEINQGQLQNMEQEHNFVHCATDWVGMACSDLPPTSPSGVIAAALAGDLKLPNCDVPGALVAEADLSNFPTLVDRLDQAFVNFMYLGRLMIHPDGFSSSPAFRNDRGSVIDTRRLFYDGNSQGGIFGGALIALEPDLNRGVIGVPSMNYAVLLQRSSDFGTGKAPQPSPTNLPGSLIPEYAYVLYQSYPDQLQRQLILSLIQQMWDHSDPDGLAQHMTTDPLPNTPAHHVLMQVALGDHQVSQYEAAVEARTIGARARLPWADPGRQLQVDPTYGLPPISSYPFDGSAITLWDIGPVRSGPCAAGETRCGTAPPPLTNTPPSVGEDPHEAPRNAVAARQQKSEFLRIDGRVIDVCGPRPCYAGSWTGP